MGLIIKYTNDIIDKRLEGTHIFRIGECINSKTKIKFGCTIHNCTWDMTPFNVLRGCVCPECSKKKTCTNELIDERLIGTNIIRIENCVDAHTRIKFKCLIDGYEWDAKPAFVATGRKGCPKCGGHLPLSN